MSVVVMSIVSGLDVYPYPKHSLTLKQLGVLFLQPSCLS